MTEQNNRPTDAQLAQDLRKGALGGVGGRILEILGGIAVAVGLAAGVLLPVILAGAVLLVLHVFSLFINGRRPKARPDSGP